jgi:hypothetical protein
MKFSLLIFLFLTQGLQASTSVAMKAYLALKQDPELYVGEGTVDLKDFDGSPKALDAARSRAQASLAEAVHVRITSETRESLKSEDGKVSEKIESQAKSKADLELENVKLMELLNFPEDGQATVVASLSKEDYRRQLAGKAVLLYSPENGLRLSMGFLGGDGWTGGNNDPILGLDIYWHSLIAGVSLYNQRITYQLSPTPGVLEEAKLYRLWDLSLGYDWVPRHWKLQPYVPLRLNYQLVNATPYIAHLFGASAGLGLRYWATDSFAFDLGWRYTLGFNQSPLTNDAGAQYYDYKAGAGKNATLTGQGISLGLLWSGF